jgi:hypothetical protein
VRVTLDSEQRVRAVFDGGARFTPAADSPRLAVTGVTRAQALWAVRARLQRLLVGPRAWDRAEVSEADLTLGFDPDHATPEGNVALEYHAVATLHAGPLTRLYPLSVPAQSL